MTDRISGRTTTPYGDAARVYRDLGWRGVLPADLNGRPGHVPAGFSGGHDVDPDDDQVAAWVASHGDHNVALRLPDDVLGLDVDVYGDKHGDQTVDYVAYQLGGDGAGELPPTWTSTARGADQRSRIHLYRVPAGGRWRSDLGRGSSVEVIRRGHRWVRCWPSINRKAPGEPVYRWYRPDGTESDRPPRPEELAELPSAWLDVLRDDAAIQLPGRASAGDRGDHRHDDAPSLDQDGQPVDPDLILERGLGTEVNQQVELFRYMCSLRARNLRRSEMIALGMCALQRISNVPGHLKGDWCPDDIIKLVDRVRREYAPGGATQLTPAMQAFAERVRTGTITVDEPPLVEESATDLGNSLRFARLFRDRVRYAADVERWYVWDGRRWAPDRTGRVVDLTKHVIDDVRRTALTETGDDQGRWTQWAHQSESLARREATIKGARSEPGIVVQSDVFDTDPQLLVVRNGTLDLLTGELRPSEPTDLCSQLAEVDYDPDATYERWIRHVRLLCRDDQELVAYMARAVGYTLTGDVGARSFFFLEGRGSNGKNTFIEPIMQMMGSYAQTAAPSLVVGGEDQHPTVIADLLGARLVFVDETRKEQKLNAERIKALTGSKLLKARQMRKDFFQFEARFKLWIAGNGAPRLQDDSDGVWKRLHRIVCHGKVTDAQRIDRFGDVLYQEEAGGILNWALTGLRDYRTRRLATPETVVADVASFRHDENYELQFFEEYVEVTGDPADRLTSQQLFAAYERWCEFNGVRTHERKNNVYLSRSVSGFELDGVGPAEWKMQGRKVRGFNGIRWIVSTDD